MISAEMSGIEPHESPDSVPEQFELDLELHPSKRLLSVLTPDEIFSRLDHFLFDQLKEDRRIEKKSASVTPRALGDYFSMWSNTSPDGGLIFVGIDNDGTVTGCNSLPMQTLNSIEGSSQIFCPDAKVNSRRIPGKNHEGIEDFVVAFRVDYHITKVVKTAAGHVFARSADNKREIHAEEFREMQIAKGEVHHELESVPMDYPNDFEKPLLKEFTKNVKKAKSLEYVESIGHLLAQHRLGIIQKGKFIPNNACCLLFGKDPRKQFPGCKLRIMRFDGEQENTGERYALVKDIDLEGPIPRIIAEAEKAIGAQLREYSALGPDGRFYAVPEYPFTAWYEAIVNACVHRSYNLKTMHIFVKIFDDRMEIISPGSFPPLCNSSKCLQYS